MFKKALSLLLLLAVFYSCSNRKQEIAGEEIAVSPSSIQDTFRFSEIYNKYEVIPLEITNESIIGTIVNIVKWGDRYFVGDDHTHKLLVFDSTGKYLYQIGKQGRGPGEHNALYDFTIGPDSIVYILSNRHLHKYKTDGTFIAGFPIYSATHLAVDGECIYLYANSGGRLLRDTSSYYQLYVTDKNGKETGHFLLQGSVKSYPDPTRINQSRPFTAIPEGFLFYMPLHETIYTLNKGSFTPWFTLNYGENAIPESFFSEQKKNPGRNFSEALDKTNYARDLLHVYALSGGLRFTVWIGQYSYNIWVKDGKLYRLEDDLLGPVENLAPFLINEREYIGTLSPVSWLMFLKYKKDESVKERFKSLINMDETSNPVIIRYWKE